MTAVRARWLRRLKVLAGAAGIFLAVLLASFVAFFSLGYFILIDRLRFPERGSVAGSIIFLSAAASVLAAVLVARHFVRASWPPVPHESDVAIGTKRVRPGTNFGSWHDQSDTAIEEVEGRASARHSVRHAHCWKCHQSLSSLQHDECSSCGWLICDCGACRSPDFGGCAAQRTRLRGPSLTRPPTATLTEEMITEWRADIARELAKIEEAAHSGRDSSPNESSSAPVGPAGSPNGPLLPRPTAPAIAIGEPLIHDRFGRGEVVAVRGDIVTLRFPDGTRRSFATAPPFGRLLSRPDGRSLR